MARLGTLVVTVLVLAAVDAVWTRLEQAHRPTDAALFVQATGLWLAYGVIALVPAHPTAKIALGLRRAASPAAVHSAALAFWIAFPCVGHQVLDRHTAQGKDVAALARARPWLELGLATLALAALAWVVVAALRRLGAGRAGAVLAALAVAAGLLVPPRGGAEPASGAPPAAGRPNVLLLVWDTTRPDHLDAYGYGRGTTPHLARLAEESLVFENARSASIFTLTSHVSMLTGTHPSHHGARMLEPTYAPSRAPSIVPVLRDAGYRTGGFVGTAVLSARTGIDLGFEVYDDLVDPPVTETRAWALVHDVQSVLSETVPALHQNGLPHWIQDYQRPAGEVLERALAWIENGDPRPWFAFVNLYDVHWPYLPGEAASERWVRPYDGPMTGYLFRGDSVWRTGYEPVAADDRHLRDLYDGEMWELDRAVDAFFGALELDAERTAVVLTSDHGEAFGDLPMLYKHEDVYEPQVRVPLLVRAPADDRPTGRVDAPSSGVDVAPTILGLAGIAPGAPDEEEPLAYDLLSRLPPDDRPVLIEDRDQLHPEDVHLVLYEGPWKLVRREDPTTGTELELFDLRRPEPERTNLAGEEPERLAAMRERLEALRSRWSVREHEGGLGEGADISDQLEALGYVHESRAAGPDGAREAGGEEASEGAGTDGKAR